MTHPVLDPAKAEAFPKAVLPILRNTQLRKNVAHATDVIQGKRNRLVAEKDDWQELRSAGSALRAHLLENLGAYLEQFEERCTAAGGVVHWAGDAEEARRIILEILREEQASEVIKIKTMTSAEIQLNPALEAAGIKAFETDLAEIILQLGEDEPSHIVVPALHVNRTQVREIFARRMNLPELSDDPQALTAAAREFLRRKFLDIPTAISGANFLIAETGSVVIVESEGNGRMCLTLPRTMITLAGIEKVLPRFADLEIMLQVLARSATGERMNPYNSIWTGVTPGDGPQRFHVVLLDNGRSAMLKRKVERQTLKCIRCGACMNTCPVYRQTGGHAYGSVYAGPIGAILTPQLQHLEHAQTLPYASSLCGACYEVCPVKINIPEVLIELRAQVTDKEREEERRFFDPMYLGMRIANFIFARAGRFRAAQRMGRIALKAFTGKDGWIHSLPGMGGRWTMTRDLRGLPDQTFREWWAKRGPAQTASVPEQRASELAAPSESVSRLATVRTGPARNGPQRTAVTSRGTGLARAAILDQIQAAAMGGDGDEARAYAEIPRTYVQAGSLDAEKRIKLMIERLREYDAEVVETAPDGVAAAVAAQLKASGRGRFVAPVGVPSDWLASGYTWALDRNLGTDEIEKAEGVVTGASCAVAESGTIVLHHTAQEGRRVISLLPDWHLCVLRASQIVETLPEYFARFPEPPRLATYISGPSATADIEMTRIKGVHGPRFLHVVLVRDEA